ncbi:acyltransferase family protein [Achromobacter kerstersii]|uniref:acyltransferase family protein n=1 Tax=Achromobacter kerstersii TaxID=1353890 RepID=UPI003D026608
MRHPSHGIAYRSDIDGLRAVAIISVVIYHALPGVFPGGFVGVDVFFVISGFLISSILLRNLHQGSFSIASFYISRTRRLLPALVTVLCAAYAAGWFLLMPQEFSQLGTQIVGGATFLQNFVLWRQDGYFDTASELKPLMHLWSLGIEEQFYLIYPLILWISFKRKSCLLAILTCTVVSFSLNVLRIQGHPVEVFFLPHTRFWELLLGGALAYWMLNPNAIWHRLPSGFSNLASALGLIMIAVSVVLMDSHRSFPGWWALVPVAGTLLLLATANRCSLGHHVLSSRVFVYIGLISYPLYLWHWPLLSFGKMLDPSLPTMTRIALAGASMILAAITYHLIEKPLRARVRPRIAVPLLAGSLAIAGFTGFQAVASQGLPSRLPEALQAVATYHYAYETDARYPACWLTAKDSGSGFAPECFENLGKSGDKSLIVWGDSYAARLYPGIAATFGARYAIAQTTRNSCPPLLNNQYDTCRDSNEFTLSLIKKNSNAAVVLFAVWDQYSKDWVASSPERDALIRTIRAVKAAGTANLVLIGPAPRWPENLPTLVLKTWKNGALSQETPDRLKTPLSPMIQAIDKALREISVTEGISYVSAFDTLCNADGCLVKTSDDPISFTTWDIGHLTTEGAKTVARAIPMP